jgi:hypothetical protein
MPVSRILGQNFPVAEYLNIYQPNALANGPGKRIQDIYGWGDPFCEPVVANLRLAKCGDLLSKDVENILGGFTGLKVGKEWMRDQVLLSFTFVGFQSGIENGRKVRLRGGCGGGSNDS